MKKTFILLIFVSFIILFIGHVNADQITAQTDEITYVVDDIITISGTINTTNVVSITAIIYSDSIMNTSSTSSSGGSTNTFTIINEINDSYEPDEYFVNVTDGINTVRMSFKVVPSIIYLEPHLIGDPNKTIQISTSTRITNANANYAGGNFSELVALSRNATLQAVFYGNATIPLSSGNKTYHFVVVDEDEAESYDKLYVDDDKNFLIYNTNEDVSSSWESERIKRIGEGIKLNGTDEYVIGFIDFANGGTVVLTKPINTSAYNLGDPVYFVIISKDSEGGVKPNQPFQVNLTNSTGYVFASISNTTNSFGVFVSNFTAPQTSGGDILNVNNSLGLEFFSVETFKLYGKITDLLDNPTYTFTPNSLVRISATVKSSSDDPIEPSSIYAIVKYPNGTSQQVTLTGGNGTFSYDLSPGSSQGEYGIKIVVTYSSNKQEFSTSFTIRSFMAEVEAINTEFLGEAQDKEVFVNAFAPNTNVTLLVVLSDIENGGFFSQGPEGEGSIDIDDPNTPTDECGTLVSVVSIEDDKGKDVTNLISYQVMNLTNFLNFIGGTPGGEEGPSPSMLRQCMIVFSAPNRTGIYRIKVNVKYNGDNFAGTTFGIQKYYATANPVDFTGEKDFWFYSPNSTIYIKLKVTDLANRMELNSTHIVDAKILEMAREWPSFQDMLTGDYKSNEAIIPEKGMINFTTPESEGFFDFEFKFKTDTGDEGLGTGFFMLKKYMIWGEPVCSLQPCMYAPGNNVKITVTIIPISDADKLDQGMKEISQIGSCDDCDGLIASVNSIFNDQLMKQIPASDYTVQNGTIFNSTANITIDPGDNMPTGWFSVDLILTDPADSTNQYIGWAWFEIRRVMIITDNLKVDNDGNLTVNYGEGMWGPTSFSSGQEVLFGISARDPTAPGTCVDISSVTLETVRLMNENGPPITLKAGTDYSYQPIVSRPVFGYPCELYVVNITGLDRTGNIQATFKVNTDSLGSDVWSYWFQMSSYLTDLDYRGKNNWPPTFAPNENLTINVTAYDANEEEHNLSVQGTKLKMINKDKSDTKLKLNYSTSCVGGKCTIDIYCVNDLSCLGSGEFRAMISINDTNGIQTSDEAYFVIKSLAVSVPSIEEFWIGRIDTPTKEFNLDNDGDRCDNVKSLQNDDYLSWDDVKYMWDENEITLPLLQDDCSDENNTICLVGGVLNYTVDTKVGDQYGIVFCVLDNGELLGGPETLENCPGRDIYVAGNTTHLWFNATNVTPSQVNNIISMVGISPNVNDSEVYLGNRYWIIRNVFNQETFNYIDKNILQISICNATAPDNNCTADPGDPNIPKAWVDVRVNIPTRYNSTFVIHLCANETDLYDNGADFNDTNVFCDVNDDLDYYIVSNTTYLWYNDTPSIVGSQPLKDGDEMILDGTTWKIADINKNGDGDEENRVFRIVLLEFYTKVGLNGGQTELTVSKKYNKNYGGMFCVKNTGEWQDTQGGCNEGVPVYVYSNYTHLWINESFNLVNTIPRKNESSPFSYSGKTWEIVSTGSGNNLNGFEVKSALGICGEMENATCQEQCQGPCNCPRIGYEMELPEDYSSNYHSHISNLRSDWVVNDFGQPFSEERPLYVYHNATHVFISNEPNMSEVTPVSVNGIITDPYGGQWKVKTINKRLVELEGQNILAETGAFINTSYSKSGNIRIEPIREEWLGGWDQVTGQPRGLDLDGNGNTGDTVYIVVADNAITGVYDTFFFSNTSNFSNPVPTTADRSTRIFGDENGDQLTLLSISSVSGVKVRAYSDKPSDWANLGDFKVGSNVTIPIIARTPAGTNAVANVSIYTIRMEVSGQSNQFITPSPIPSALINGVGEITVNFTAIGLTQSGEYAIGIMANNSEKLEEWKWPRVTTRSFLIDSTIGDGGYVGTFYSLPLYRYDWETYGNWIPEIRTETVDGINTTFEGVIAAYESQCAFTKPSGVDANLANWTLRMDGGFDYWLYINSGNASKVWIKNGDCNFTGIPSKIVGQQVNLTLNGHTYMFYVLYVNVTSQESKNVFIGPAGINSNLIKPIRVDENRPKWRLMSLNLSGTLYDVILANDTYDYPMCSIWNMDECAKTAWFSTTGNFSGKAPIIIGQNFTPDLYLAKIGPGSWEGITIGNFSQISTLGLSQLPGIDVRPKDDTTSYFARLNEDNLGLNLNKNGINNEIFYAVTFDDKEDSVQAPTDVTVDDDLNITEEWWADFSSNSSVPGYYKDFYENEVGMREMRSGLPRGIWGGNIRFNETCLNDTYCLSYEQSPEWEVVTYNNSHMLLKKWKNWFTQNEDVTLVLKTFEFNQSSTPNVNITIEKLMMFGSNFPIQLQSPQHYNVTGASITNNQGYVVMKIVRNTPWPTGQYNIRIRAVAPGGRVETADNWFNVQT